MTASTPESHRSVSLSRMGEGRFKATNRRGGVLPVGGGDDPDFTPVELLLTALAGCSALDVAAITGKRSPVTRFDVHAEGDKVRDGGGNHLTNLRVVLDIEFPEGAAGDAARAVLQRSIDQTRDRLCTVSRTVALGEPVAMEAGPA